MADLTLRSRDEERVMALCEQVCGSGCNNAAPTGPHCLGYRRCLGKRMIQNGTEGLPNYGLFEVLLLTRDPRKNAKVLIDDPLSFPRCPTPMRKNCLERLTEPLNEAPADEGSGEMVEGVEDVGASLLMPE
jgi:hypothetical protein